MKKFKILLGFLFVFLVACQNHTPSATLTGDPIDTNKEQIYYDPIDKKLVKFNPNGNQSQVINANESDFAYDINNADNLFIIGDSLNHKYKLVEIKEDQIEDKNKRTISLIDLEEFNITDIESVNGLLTDGIVSPNNIYYTAFNNENNYYELHRKSIEEGKKGEAPELISVGYETPELFLSKDLENEKEIMNLYASDNNKIYSKEDSWDKHQANYFKPTTVIGIDKNPDGTMKITFIEKRSREKVNEVDDVVGIHFENDSIVVATKSGASKY